MNEERDQQTTEVRDTKEQRGNTNIRRQSVTTARKVDAGVVARRIVYYLAGVITALLALRIVLLLLAANQGSGFVDFIYALSGFFAMPFYGIFNYQPSYGQSIFEISSVVAIIVYGLAALGIAKLFTLTKSDDAA
jgi:tetrahydromethanopterin S-methyltransferase subunit F